MLPEYDFSKGVRGATAKRFLTGPTVVILDDDVAALFPNSGAVNDALRLLGRVARGSTAAKRKPAPRARRRPRKR